MKTLPSKRSISTLVTAVLLICAIRLPAGTYTASTTPGTWATTTHWTPTAPTGGPGTSDTAVIPTGKQMSQSTAAKSVCTDSGQFIDVSGTLVVNAATTLGDVTVEPGGTFNGGNGKIPTFAGNYTNNGLTTIGGAGDSWIYSGVNKALSGNITNPGVTISGIYTNYGVFQCNNTPTINAGGGLTNLGMFIYKATTAPTTVLSRGDFTAPGNTLAWYGVGIANGAAVPASVYNLVIGTTAGGGATFALGATTIFGSLTLTNTTPLTTTWPANNSIPGGIIFGNTGNSTFPATFAIGGLTQLTAVTVTIPTSGTLIITNSGNWFRSAGTLTANASSTVKFVNGNSTISGSAATAFRNLYVDTNAVVTLANASTVQSGSTLTVTNGGTFNAVSDVTGAGAFTLRAGGTLGIANAAGISSTAASGGVQLSGTRVYEAGASYAYVGTAAQVTGNQLPTTANAINNLVISNSAGVTLTAGVSVTNNLVVASGTLALSGNTLSLGASASVLNNGTISGNLAPGASAQVFAGTDGGIATATYTGNLDMSAGGSFNFDLIGTAGAGNDSNSISGTLTLNNNPIKIRTTAASLDTAGYTVMSAGSISGTPNGTPVWVGTPPANSNSYAVVVVGNTVQLTGCSVPTAFSITNSTDGLTTDCSSPGIDIGLTSSQTDVSYQLKLNGSPVGSPLTGNGGALDFGTNSTAGTYTVTALADCGTPATMTGSIVLNQSPTTHGVTGGNGCSGSGVTIGLDDSDLGVSYQLFLDAAPVGSTVSGTGNAISFGLKTAPGTYTVATVATACSSVAMTGNAVITQTPGAPTGVSATAGDSQVTLSWAAPVSGPTPTGYNVKRSVISGTGYATLPAGANVSSPFIDTTAANGTVYYYVVSSLNGSCEGVNSTPQASATPNPSYSGYAITGSGTQTAGTTNTLTITAVDSGGAPVTGISGSIVLTFSGPGAAANGSGATINGTAIATPVTLSFASGAATVDLVVFKSESTTVHATDGTHGDTSTGGSGLGLTVSPAADSAYRITAATSAPVVGSSNQLSITIVDQYQNTSTTAGNKVLTFSGLASSPNGTSPTVDGAAMGGTTTVDFNIPATAQLIATKVENSKLLFATDGTLSTTNLGGTAPTLSPIVAPPSTLSVLTQPASTASAGVVLGTQPVIEIWDTFGNIVNTSTVPVSVTASAGTVQGTTTVTANGTSGRAAFSGLSLTNTGSITLNFSATGLAGTNSGAITVSGGAASQLVWATQPGGAVAGTAFATQPVLRTADAFGNFSSTGLAAIQMVTVYLSSGVGPLAGTISYNIGTAGSNGVVTFTDLQVSAANASATLTATTLSPAAATLAGSAQLWLDANNTSTIVTNLAGGVTNWNNIGTRGGTLRVATVGGTWTPPTWTANSMNSRPVVKFVASASTVGNALTNTFSPALNLGPDVHLFVVVRQPVSPNGAWSGFIGFANPAHAAGKDDSTLGEDCGNNGATDRAGFRIFRNDGDPTPAQTAPGQFNLNNGFTTLAGIINPRPALNVGFVNELYWSGSANSGNGAASDNWLAADGTTWTNYQATSSSRGNFNLVDFGLGAQLGNTSTSDQPVWAQTMDIAEVITFTNVLSAGDARTVFTYLANKWINPPLADAVTAAFTVSKGNSSSAVSSSLNPSGFGDSVIFTDTVAAASATGNVVFKVDGSAFGTNTLNGGGIASIATTTLTRGLHTVTAEYAGDSSYNGVTNDLSGGQLVTNHPPVAVADNLTRTAGISMKITIASLLANDTDLDSDAPVFDGASATTTNGATLTSDGTYVYVPQSSVTDAFTYTIDDGHGGTNTGNVYLALAGSTGQQTTVTPTSSNATAVFFGIPGQSYTVQRATNVTFTLGLSNFTSVSAPSNGVFNVTDDFNDLGAVPDSAFYRLLVP